MPSEREIRSTIAGVASVHQITQAMEMISAAKLRKSQEKMRAAQPYAQAIRSLVARLSSSPSTLRPFLGYFKKRPVKQVGYLIVSSKQGLCGGLNQQLFRHLLREMVRRENEGIGASLALFGGKAVDYFSKLSVPILAQKAVTNPSGALGDLIGLCRVMLQAYESGRIDELYVVSNQFISTSVQKPRLLPLLPMELERQEAEAVSYDLCEPAAEKILGALMTRCLETEVYGAVLENIACEQASRMIAMQSACESAESLMDGLKLEGNRIRQNKITQELSEIVAGASVIDES